MKIFLIFPKPLINEKNFNFSFSGIKTHISFLIKKNKLDNLFVNNLSASFQKTMAEIITKKLIMGIDDLKSKNIYVKSISIVGGVANNNYIRKKLENLFDIKKIKLYYPY